MNLVSAPKLSAAFASAFLLISSSNGLAQAEADIEPSEQTQTLLANDNAAAPQYSFLPDSCHSIESDTSEEIKTPVLFLMIYSGARRIRIGISTPLCPSPKKIMPL